MIEFGWGNRLKTARGGVSQTIVAAEFGTSKNTISHYETEKSAPDLPFLIRFSQRFNVTLEWIAFGSEPIPAVLDHDVLREVIEAVETDISGGDPKTKAATILMLYNKQVRVINAEREAAELKMSAPTRRRAT